MTLVMLRTDLMMTDSWAMVMMVTQMVSTVVNMSDHRNIVRLTTHTLYTSSKQA